MRRKKTDAMPMTAMASVPLPGLYHPVVPPYYMPSGWTDNALRLFPQQHTGHMLSEPEIVSHCPFCGSGDIVAGGDQTIDCSFCNRSFMVMEQPKYNSMPGQPGVGAPGGATMPGGDAPAVPGAEVPGAPVDPALGDPGAAVEEPAAPAAPINPQTDPDTLMKAPPFKFGGSLKKSASYQAPVEQLQPGMRVRQFSSQDFSEVAEILRDGADDKGYSYFKVKLAGGGSFSLSSFETVEVDGEPKTAKKDETIFRTAKGHDLNEDDFVAHVAFAHARDFMVRG